MLGELIGAEIEREAAATRKAIERIPEGNNDWRPHPRSMPLGALATLCANIFSWTELVLSRDEIDIKPAEGQGHAPPPWRSRDELLLQLEAAVGKARAALAGVDDRHLLETRWRLLAGGAPLSDQTRYEAIRDGVLNHSAHHRGQLTVYLRLLGSTVPSIYGPSGDDDRRVS